MYVSIVEVNIGIYIFKNKKILTLQKINFPKATLWLIENYLIFKLKILFLGHLAAFYFIIATVNTLLYEAFKVSSQFSENE